MQVTGQKGLVDLDDLQIWATDFNQDGWSIENKVERVETNKGITHRSTMKIESPKGEELVLNAQQMMDIASTAIQAFFLGRRFPNEAIPEPFRGDLHASTLWVNGQAKQFITTFVHQLVGQLESSNGNTWMVDLGFHPNISSSNIVQLNGSKPQTWDGSFRPVLRLTEVKIPQYTGEANDAQGSDDPNAQAAGSHSPETGGIIR